MLKLRLYRLLLKIYHLVAPNYLKILKNRGLAVGRNFDMEEGVVIDEGHCWLITIGDDVTLAARVRILAHDASTRRRLGYTRIGKVNISNSVFIGAGSIILPGVTIGHDVVIGAGSVVAGDIPDGVVAAGNPARVIGQIDEFFSRHKKEMAIYPCFGEEYTVSRNVTAARRSEMVSRMKDRYGYVV
jgi:maltose O-acetyltransferase